MSTLLGNVRAPCRNIAKRPKSNCSTASSVSLFKQARSYKRRKMPWEALQHEPKPLNPKLMPKTAAERDAFLCGGCVEAAAASSKCAGCKKILPAEQFNEKNVEAGKRAAQRGKPKPPLVCRICEGRGCTARDSALYHVADDSNSVFAASCRCFC